MRRQRVDRSPERPGSILDTRRWFYVDQPVKQLYYGTKKDVMTKIVIANLIYDDFNAGLYTHPVEYPNLSYSLWFLVEKENITFLDIAQKLNQLAQSGQIQVSPQDLQVFNNIVNVLSPDYNLESFGRHQRSINVDWFQDIIRQFNIFLLENQMISSFIVSVPTDQMVTFVSQEVNEEYLPQELDKNLTGIVIAERGDDTTVYQKLGYTILK